MKVNDLRPFGFVEFIGKERQQQTQPFPCSSCNLHPEMGSHFQIKSTRLSLQGKV